MADVWLSVNSGVVGVLFMVALGLCILGFGYALLLAVGSDATTVMVISAVVGVFAGVGVWLVSHYASDTNMNSLNAVLHDKYASSISSWERPSLQAKTSIPNVILDTPQGTKTCTLSLGEAPSKLIVICGDNAESTLPVESA